MKIAFLLVGLIAFSLAGKPIIRGLSKNEMTSMNYSDKEFTCRDGSQKIPFQQVNDNYCDCKDGSDEPGTPACSNGVFHCTNKGYIGWKIFSSRVQDGVCDCCDGSDEEGIRECPNTCKALADEAKKSFVEDLNKAREGMKIKKEYIEEAVRDFAEKEIRLATLEAEIPGVQQLKQEQEEKRNEAQRIEDIKRKEIQARKDAEEAQRKAEEAANAPPQEQTEAPTETKTENANVPSENPDEANEEEEEEYEEGDEEETEEEEEEEEEEQEPAQPSIDEDPELKPLVEETKKLRDDVSETERKLRNLERERDDIKALFTRDFGPEREYYSLSGKCFTVDTVEYTYEICPYDKANQKPKHGGQTNLGKWNDNQGDEWTKEHKYMMFTGGLKCWGGPDRSSKVEVICDKENRLADPAEPNKCEYTFKFYTPAACTETQLQALEAKLRETEASHTHDEL